MGAGQAATTASRGTPPAADQGRQPEPQPGRVPAPRRPSESVEAGDAAQGRVAEAVSPQAAAAAPMRSTGPQEFEE